MNMVEEKVREYFLSGDGMMIYHKTKDLWDDGIFTYMNGGFFSASR